MKAIAIAFAVLAAASVAHAGQSCHFNTPNAIVCTQPRNAAVAYADFGTDAASTNLSFNRAMLHQSGCGRAYGARYATARIEQMRRGRVALPTGWIDVSTVIVNGKDIWYVASRYIDGACPAYKPSVQAMKLN